MSPFLQRNACVSPPVVALNPTTSPDALTAWAELELPPKVPRSVMVTVAPCLAATPAVGAVGVAFSVQLSKELAAQHSASHLILRIVILAFTWAQAAAKTSRPAPPP